MRLLWFVVLVACALALPTAAAQTARQFEAVSADGYRVQGQADLPAGRFRGW